MVSDRRISIILVCCLVGLPFAGPLSAAEPASTGAYELKVAQPMQPPRGYTEAFPTEVEATARLWNMIKIDAVSEQTRALREDFENHKSLFPGRGESIADQCGIISAQMQPQLDVGEQMLFSSVQPAIRWGR